MPRSMRALGSGRRRLPAGWGEHAPVRSLAGSRLGQPGGLAPLGPEDLDGGEVALDLCEEVAVQAIVVHVAASMPRATQGALKPVSPGRRARRGPSAP